MIKKFFEQVWNDSVFSQVIASVIFLVLSNFLAYLVSVATQNFWIAIIIGILVFTASIAVFLVRLRSNGVTLDVNDRFISASCSGDKIEDIQNFIFYGQNKSNKPIQNIQGVLRSNITNETYPIYFAVDGDLVLPQETYGIPPKAHFQIIIPFYKESDGGFAKGSNGKWDANRGLDTKMFNAQLKDTTLALRFDKKVFTYHITPRKISQAFEKIQKSISPPIESRVTRKNIN